MQQCGNSGAAMGLDAILDSAVGSIEQSAKCSAMGRAWDAVLRYVSFRPLQVHDCCELQAASDCATGVLPRAPARARSTFPEIAFWSDKFVLSDVFVLPCGRNSGRQSELSLSCRSGVVSEMGLLCGWF